MLFRDSANDGFHEAIGDTIALSITPEYLVKIGLLDKAPDASADIGLLLQGRARAARVPAVRPGHRSVALAGVRGQGHAGRLQQGVVGAARSIRASRRRTPRGEEFFDPGAKYHVPANTPYSRYFLAAVLQFQFHRALAKTAGLHGAAAPLLDLRAARRPARSCKAMLEMGASRPWPDALEALTGQRQMDATAMADYFAPLKAWLDEQNAQK